ncbi:glycosyltransferase family 2 protein [Chryseobacterium caseinilyticum]|uniref:Glycosyltransferase family 2 protein n=1 Tax=Chryseobacterium caseinilyticum TaxID=2771428 RepID=A0ABR8ZG89_9FLAO|nr:glycosyltransferase family 2 protein [Chryseobacterium caseinilyticum]MBD8084320.1 glycosyltransferase family 2 protein [Chryseobacterium caseinilyticum]
MKLNISVVIPVYNASLYLRNAVNSAIQFDEVQEVILVEDLSTDDSFAICEQLVSEDPRIKLFQHPDKANHGAAASRNLGIEKAQSEYIAFLDADDYYLPNRFQAEKNIFEDPKTEGVFGALGVEYLSEKGREEFQNKFKDTALTTVKFAAEGEEIFKGLLGLSTNTFGSFFHLNTLTVKKSSLANHRFNEDLRVHQDSDFIIKLSYHSYLKTGIIDNAIAIRGVHDNNRITKIKPYSEKFYRNNLLLQKSLYQWSKSASLNNTYRKKIKLDYLSFGIACKKGISKWFSFFKTVLRYPEFIRTKYRFHALNKHIDD